MSRRRLAFRLAQAVVSPAKPHANSVRCFAYVYYYRSRFERELPHFPAKLPHFPRELPHFPRAILPVFGLAAWPLNPLVCAPEVLLRDLESPGAIVRRFARRFYRRATSRPSLGARRV